LYRGGLRRHTGFKCLSSGDCLEAVFVLSHFRTRFPKKRAVAGAPTQEESGGRKSIPQHAALNLLTEQEKKYGNPGLDCKSLGFERFAAVEDRGIRQTNCLHGFTLSLGGREAKGQQGAMRLMTLLRGRRGTMSPLLKIALGAIAYRSLTRGKGRLAALIAGGLGQLRWVGETFRWRCERRLVRHSPERIGGSSPQAR
jgi:hypothetical protein